MSLNINLKTETKTPVVSSNIPKTTFITTTNNESGIQVRSEVNSLSNQQFVKFNSQLMCDLQRRNSNKFLNFEDDSYIFNEEFKEYKDNFIYKECGKYKLYDTASISEISEYMRLNDVDITYRLYSSVIKGNKDKILQIKNSQLDLKSSFKANFIYSKMEESLHTLCDELLCLSEGFENEVINKICSERVNNEQIQKLRNFISEILDSKTNLK
jgi:hypothetical protein